MNGKRLKELLAEKGKPKIQLGRATVWRHVHGERLPDLKSLRIYANFLGMTLDELCRELEIK
jgi:transcriptional regulator with XRE-family HTH domain